MSPKVSIIIPYGYNPLLKGIFFIKKNIKPFLRDKKYEVIIVDNSNFEEDVVENFYQLKKLGCKILPFPFKFSYPAIYNYAAKFSSGEFLVFLDTYSFLKKVYIDKMISNFLKFKDLDVALVNSINLTISEKIETKVFLVLNFIYYFLKPLKFLYYFIKTKRNTNRFYNILLKLIIYNLYILVNFYFSFLKKEKNNFVEIKNLEELASQKISLITIKKHIFEKLNGFDEEYNNFYYKYDLLMKATTLGYKVLKDNSIKVLYIDSFNLGHFKYNKFPKIYDEKIFLNKWVKKNNNNDKILVIKLMSMGDVIMCSSVIKALKEKFPKYKIVVVSLEPWSEVFDGLPFIDELITIKKTMLPNLAPYKIYDLITAKFVKEFEWFKVYQLNCLDHYPEYRRTSLHLCDFYASMAKVYPLKDPRYYINIESRNIYKIEDILKNLGLKDKQFIVAHTNAGWRLKNWEEKKWLELLEKIHKKYGLYVIIVGGKDEAKGISSGYIFNLAGKLSIKETAALIKKSQLFIGLDSGPMHLASAVDIPVVALFGNTHPKTSEPRCSSYICVHSRMSCEVPCGLKFCKKNINCTSYISVEAVFKAVDKLLNNKNIKEIWIEDKPAKVFLKDWEWHIVES
ncbi:MAG: glycosyltransferase family 9 protein [Elusimicrobiota bacterium]|nr:hypothetical protein [Endomicrobiia bacterium]MDW8165596.1 glycosyltransferase family 9 protein [Elusimicrobiota bacterium]